ncbi:hypothetical protein [Nostoc sp. TCL240-02]|uniref:hypothetical protein n=1 Tax=Nostoc sp. TCL240-02 TaxID=2572090 RepID=UPI00157F8C43|nr:hypothetical protein [Nostoc sp. TCL240-02]QKQ75658.1 hypothetical protein FBB35_22285 [Nostoc sp. TCL240-02]
MNSQDFLASGYMRYKNTGFRKAEFLLQKRIYDVIGTKYFINIYACDLQGKEVLDSEVQFTKNLKLYCITVSKFQSAEEIEKIFEDLWERMCFDYQERTS